MYDFGKGCEIDYSKAMKYFQMAAEKGNAYGQYNIGWDLILW